MNIQRIETPLTIQQEFELVKIAHETSNYDIKEIALHILNKSLNSLIEMKANLGD